MWRMYSKFELNFFLFQKVHGMHIKTRLEDMKYKTVFSKLVHLVLFLESVIIKSFSKCCQGGRSCPCIGLGRSGFVVLNILETTLTTTNFIVLNFNTEILKEF